MNPVGVWESQTCWEWRCGLGCARFKGKFHEFGDSRSEGSKMRSCFSWLWQRTGTLCFPKPLNTNQNCCPWECPRDQILAVVRKTLSRLWWNKKHFLFCGAVHPAKPRGKSDPLWVLNIPSFHGGVNTSAWGLCSWDSSGGFPRDWTRVNWMDFIPSHLKSLRKAKLERSGTKTPLSFHLPVQFWKLRLWWNINPISHPLQNANPPQNR